jgi:hypothetical protein
MAKAKFVILSLVILAFGWMVLFQGIHPASSSPLLGFTVTPTPEQPKPTPTPKITTVPPTLPPPLPPEVTPDSPLIIPVTGADKTASVDNVVNIGMVLLAFGLIAAGITIRKQKK